MNSGHTRCLIWYAAHQSTASLLLGRMYRPGLGLLRVAELKGLSLEEIDAVFADEVSAEARLRRERIADELGLHNMANVAADGLTVDRRDPSSTQEVEMLEDRCVPGL
ncbi:hypothetical protein BDV30DRAFT_238271 [Aspergillus minisclerotigenes]|uniref:Uncharacterized protein n=1 Tax=Aspergillus minisclerotigenes TaxID=656917 RepID=A0A5N6J4M8_9EURO|nr:hypothetical protein BDV30DRAFT_238271 [Aspergillus minisclerotigenes]